MGAVILDGSVKPAQWGLDPGLVAPEWEWFWNHAIFASDLQHNLFDHVQKDVGTLQGTASVTDTRKGPAVDTTAATSDRLTWPQSTKYAFSGDIALTIYVSMIWQADAGGFPGIITFRQTNSIGRWQLYKSSSTLLFAWTNGAGSQSVSLGNIETGIVAGDLLNIVVTRQIGGAWSSYKNGVLLATPSDIENFTSASETLHIGALGGDATVQNNKAQYLAAGVLTGYAATASNVRQLQRDSFGPFRMVDEAAFFVPAAATLQQGATSIQLVM